MAQGQGVYSPSPTDGPLLQGEILSNLQQVLFSLDSLATEEREFEIKTHPWAIVITQDCDLDQDYTKGRGSLVPNILFCEMSTADQLSALLRTSGQGSGKWQLVRQNNEPRYHFLEKADPTVVEGLEEFGMDFKRYFTLPTPEVYFQLTQNARRHCVLNSPYLEHLAQRFSAYLSRVALDSDHTSE